ncbi:hypothetical protein BCT84_15275 [Vibrio breoganii]|nr:hypothetical protein BCT84_15275 [Vibrio breoganii]
MSGCACQERHSCSASANSRVWSSTLESEHIGAVRIEWQEEALPKLGFSGISNARCESLMPSKSNNDLGSAIGV